MVPEDEEVAPGWLPPRAPADRTPAAPARRLGGAGRAPGTLPAPPGPARPAGPTDPLAPLALGLGVIAFLLLLLSAGAAFIVALPCAIAGWRLGVASRRRIADGRAVAGDGVAQAAVLLGLACVGIAAVAAIAWIILASNGYTPDDLQRSLEQRLERQRR